MAAHWSEYGHISSLIIPTKFGQSPDTGLRNKVVLEKMGIPKGSLRIFPISTLPFVHRRSGKVKIINKNFHLKNQKIMEMLKEISRSCKECGGLLLGRIDQVYCGDLCRTSANNKRVREQVQRMPECIQRIQKNLLQNYKILTGLRNRGSQLFSKLYLMDLGFNFHHVTGVIEKDGTVLYYCFNQGYALSGEQVILLPETLA